MSGWLLATGLALLYVAGNLLLLLDSRHLPWHRQPAQHRQADGEQPKDTRPQSGHEPDKRT